MLRNWDLNIQILRDSSTSIHEQIEHAIITQIKKGILEPGFALPGTRALATHMKVNRKTVIQAYENLSAKGWLVTEVKRGTFVAYKSQKELSSFPKHSQNFENYDQSTLENRPLNFSHLDKEMIEFSTGLPDSRLIPFNLISRALRHALIRASRDHYHENRDILGSPELRKTLFTMLNSERSINGHLNQICTMPNLTMCLHIVAKTLVNTGQKVMLEAYCDPSIVDLFTNVGAEIIYIPVDQDGIDVDYIENSFLSENPSQKICAVYVSPNYQVPTNACLSLARRKKLLTLAEKFNFKIVENDDGYYFNYQRIAYLPLASSQNFNHVIYIGSLAKAISSSLSIGYIVGDAAFIHHCAKKHALISQHNLHITEMALDHLLTTGQIKKHINRNKKVYESRMKHLLDLIKKELSDFVSVTSPSYGLNLWLKVDKIINLERLITDLKRLNVSITSDKTYAKVPQTTQGIVLGFANLNEDEATEGVYRMKQAILAQKPI